MLESVQFSPAFIRAVAVLVPFGVALVLFMVHQPKPRAAGGMLLATLWNIFALLGLNLAAQHLGWWHFNAVKATFLGVPTDLYLGWAVLWGALPILALSKMRLEVVLLILAVVDLVYMPLAFPVVQLEGGWLFGEAVCLIFAALPAQLLGRWTRDSSHLNARVALQMLLFTGLYFFVLAALVLELSGKSWLGFLARPTWLNIVFLPCAVFPGILAVSAVLEFAKFGGTPFPWDAPNRLVTTGPYGFVKNPMQLGASLLALIWGAFLGSWELMLASVMAVSFSASLAKWQEHADLKERFEGSYLDYDKGLKDWIPRWTTLQTTPSRLQIPVHSKFYALYIRQKPVFLVVETGEKLEYQTGDGSTERGVDALARALEHLNLAWAVLAWIIRLPVVRELSELWITALGVKQRRVSGEL
jgi:protein-S-isoprenylcysteine O-methyltransferase Ste14